MKYWGITLALSLLWAGVMFGVTYLITRFQNDALDQKLGQITGFGFAAIWMIAIFRNFKKQTD
jgi:hypothetical protein